MKKKIVSIFVVLSFFLPVVYTHAEDQNHDGLIIQYNGYSRASENAIILDVVFIQPQGKERFDIYSDLNISVVTDGGLYHSPISLIDDGTPSYTPSSIIHCFDEVISKVSVSGEIMCSSNPDKAIKIDIVLYKYRNKKHTNIISKISSTGSVTETVTLFKENNIFSYDKLRNGAFAAGRTTLANVLFTIFRWVLLVYFARLIYKLQFGHEKIFATAEKFFLNPTEKQAKTLIKLLNKETHDTGFVLSFRERFDKNFYNYDHAVRGADLRGQTKRELNTILYTFMYKPIEKGAFIDSPKAINNTETESKNI